MIFKVKYIMKEINIKQETKKPFKFTFKYMKFIVKYRCFKLIKYINHVYDYVKKWKR